MGRILKCMLREMGAFCRPMRRALLVPPSVIVGSKRKPWQYVDWEREGYSA